MPTFQEKLIKMLRINEGVRTKVYKDSLGIETIGVGFNMRRPDAKSIVEALNIDYDALLHGTVELTQSQVDALLIKDIDAVTADLSTLFSNFISLPEQARLVLCDMRFQLGAHGLRNFANTIKAFQLRNWVVAARGIRSSLAYKQAPVRWERNALALESIK